MLSDILITVLILALIILCISYICFRRVFYAPGEKGPSSDELPVPTGKAYEPYHSQMKQWILEARALQSEDFYIKSFDGLTLHAKYYEYEKGATTEIMFHGYRSKCRPRTCLCGG